MATFNVGTTGQLQSGLGVKSKFPDQNIKSTKTTLAPAQVSQPTIKVGTLPQLAQQQATAKAESGFKMNQALPANQRNAFTAPNTPNPNIPANQGMQTAQNNYPMAGNGVPITPPPTPKDSPNVQPPAGGTSTPPVNQYQAPASGGYYGQLISGLAGMGATETPEVRQARESLQNIQNLYANRTGALERSGVDMSLATGEEGVMARQRAAQEAAAQGAVSNALASQSQRIGALGTAAGLAAPQQAPALGFYSPATGQFTQYGGGQGGGAFGAGQVTGNVALGQQYSSVLQPAYTQASTIKDKLVEFLKANPDINPTMLSRGNALMNAVRGELSDPKANQLAQLLTEYTNTLSPIIGVTGGTVTDFKQGLVNALLNPSARNEDLQAMLGTTQDIVGGKLTDFVKSGTGQGTQPNQNQNAAGNKSIGWGDL